MSIVVAFMKAGPLGPFNASAGPIGIGDVRATEILSVPGTTTNVAAAGEMIVVVSTEATAVLGAVGSDPDAAARASTGLTRSAFAIPPLQPVPVRPTVGDKLNVKAL